MRKFLARLADSRLRLLVCAVLTFVLLSLVALITPVRLPLAAYKLVLILLGGLAGYWFDRVIYPYAEPSSYLDDDWRDAPDADRSGTADYPVAKGCERLFAMAQKRQAALIIVGMIVAGIGL